MQGMLTLNQPLIRNKFSKVIECLKKMKHTNEYKTFKNKSITKKHLRIEYKMFELKYGNNKL